MRFIPLSFALVACTSPSDGDVVYKGETGDTYVPWPEDTADEGTDNDGDGWSVEEGDCDDDDIYVHPGWEESAEEENHEDGKDNDCDGRTDEAFRGLVVLQQGDGEAPARLVGLDDFGDTEWEVTLDDPDLTPYFMAERLDDEGWIIGTLGSHDSASEILYAVYTVDSDGSTALLWDFSDDEAYPNGLWGMAAHQDGYYLLTTGDSLYSLEPDGSSLTPLGTWDVESELFAFDVAVEYNGGDVGVFGLYGGFATLEDGALTTHKTFDPENIEYVFWSGAHRDEGGWYGGGEDADGWAVFRFNMNDSDWVRKASFSEDWSPRFMTVDSVTGGYYLSTTDATYPVVWRIPEEGGTPSMFFLSPYADNDFGLWDLYVRY